MNGRLAIVTCAAGAAWEATVVRGLQRPELGIDVVRRCVDHGELLGVARRDRPQAVVLSAGLPWLDRDLVGELQDAGVAVVAVGEVPGGRDPGITHRVAADVSAAELAALLHRELAARDDAHPAEPRADGGRLVAVWGPGGAPGRTAVATHLGVELAASGVAAALVDADVWSPSVAQLLALRESPSLAEAASASGEGRLSLGELLQEGPCGLAVLAGLPRAELWPEVRARAWHAVLDALVDRSAVVVADLAAPIEEDEELSFDRVPYRRNLVTRTTLERADDVIVVVDTDPVGMRRAIVACRALRDEIPSAAARATVVLNRADPSPRRRGDCRDALEEWAALEVSATLPPEPALRRVAWEGRTLRDLASRSRWLRGVRSLAAEVAA